MTPNNAKIAIEIIFSPFNFFRVKSEISLLILLSIRSHGDSCDLKLLGDIPATNASIRSHVIMLVAEKMINLHMNRNDRRKKTISLTPEAIAKLRAYDAWIGNHCLSYDVGMLEKG